MDIRLSLVALDCPDPLELAGFYRDLTGWPIDHISEDWVELDAGAGVTIACQKVEDFTPPEWPGSTHPQQLHLDFDVSDLDEGEARALEVGAKKTDVQPKPDSWRVFLDPVGHPFCLVLADE
ncbi:MAG: VOC family protein [Acidimicrobiia bacterium]|nr:VOC family protein [Acidimicrobiia bacterium]NNL27762.1 VOC family protein [Acidimicrobiia bacterium]